MYPSAQDLPALISSRICHDLASPLMAIQNGLEMLELSGLAQTPETVLLADSVRAARTRMEFFRIAFGSATREAEVPADKCRAVLADHLAERRIAVRWQSAQRVTRREAKLAFLLAQCCEVAMPRGGTLEICGKSEEWRLSARSETLRHDPEVWALLLSRDGEVAPARVQFVLAAELAAGAGLSLLVTPSEGALSVVAAPEKA